MSVKLHQPVAGLGRGDTYSGPMESWLLANGYASREDDLTDKQNLTGVTEDQNPMLAENREDAGDEVKVLGEGFEEPAPENAPDANPQAIDLPDERNLIVGVEEDDDVLDQVAERDGRVDPEDVSGFPAELEDAVAAAADAEQTGDHLLNEPTDEVKEPVVRTQDVKPQRRSPRKPKDAEDAA